MSEEGSFGRAPAIVKPIYFFDEADGRNKMLLGGKGAGLAEMTKLRLPVPPGFIITTEICEKFYEAGKRLPDGLMDEVRKSIRRLEGACDCKRHRAKEVENLYEQRNWQSDVRQNYHPAMPADPPRPQTIVAQRLQRFEIIGDDDADAAATRLSSLKIN